MAQARNVFGKPLEPCSTSPMTGFFRDGCCHTGPEDAGAHLVCIHATAEFLAFSRAVGNDLSTPIPQWNFPGVRPGDRWCLCVTRWMEARDAGMAPPVYLEGTHAATLEFVSLSELREFAMKSEE